MPQRTFAQRAVDAVTALDLSEFSGVVGAHEPSGGSDAVGSQAGRRLVARAAGLANRTHGVANTLDTVFAIASGTKLFTATGTARLVESGDLAFDTTVKPLIPGGLPKLDSRATVAHLLTHTSGFYDYHDEVANPDSDEFFVDIPWINLETPSDYLPLMRGAGMVADLGEPFRYNNGDGRRTSTTCPSAEAVVAACTRPSTTWIGSGVPWQPARSCPGRSWT
jgi:CubicO group peptidase (beta-lactamase class C family)